MNRTIPLLLCLLVIPSVTSALTGEQTCEKMIARGNSSNMSITQCLCLMEQGNKHLDQRVGILWREALYFGESRMNEIANLGISEAKLTRQMKKLALKAKRVCRIDM